MAQEFSLKAVLGVDDQASGPIGRIRQHFDQLKGNIQSSETRLKSFNKHMSDLKKGAAALAAGGFLAKGLAATVGPAKSFDKELGLLKATAQAGTEEMKSFTDAALKAGVATQFSPDQAAQGLTNLASSGLSASQSVKALIPSLNLAEATAGELDVSGATELTSSIKASFGDLSGGFTHISDVLTRMKQLSGFKFNELSGAFRGVASTARSAGQSFESVSAILSVMRTAGETSVGTGEKMRIALNALQNPSKRATQGLGTLGVSARDQAGNMRNYIDIFSDLQGKLQGYNKAQRDRYLADILGVEGVKAYNFAVNAQQEFMENGQKVTLKGIDVLRRLDKEYKNSAGTTQGFADIQRNTFEGQINLLSGTWETIKLTFGQTFLPALSSGIKLLRAILDPMLEFLNQNEAVRSVIGWVSVAVTGFLTLSGGIKVARASLGLYKLMTLTTTAANGGFITSLWAKRTAIWANVKAAWAFAAALLANPITWIVVGIAALVAALVSLIVYWDQVKAAIVSAWEWFWELIDSTTWLKAALAVLTGPIGALILYWDELKSSFASLGQVIGSIWESFKQSFSGLLNWFGNLGSKIWKTFISGLKRGFNVVKGSVGSLLEGIRKFLPFSDAKEGPLSNLTKSGMSFTQTFGTGIVKASPDLKSAAQKVLGDINLTPGIPQPNINQSNSLIQNLQQGGGARITAGSLVTLNINGAETKISVDSLARSLAQLLTQEINKQEVHV